MSITRILLEAGYILHTRLYGETSLLVELFTRHHGRVSVVARGVRKTSIKKSNRLQLFTAYDFSWVGRSTLYTLTQAESQGFIHLFSPAQLCCGLYVNELLLRVLDREDPHIELYEAYQQLLKKLQGSPNSQIPLRLFEKRLLQNLGYGLALEKIAPEAFYLFRLSEGFIQTAEKNQHAFSGESLIAFSENALQEKHLSEIKRLMRLALSPLIGERPLRSRELFV